MTNGTEPEPEPEPEEIDWLGCIPWNGVEATLPTGGTTKAAWWPEKFVFRWVIGNAEIEGEPQLIKPSEFKEEMRDWIVGAQINENLIKAIVKTYGKDFMMLEQSTGEGKLTLEGWYNKYGTDGLVLWAIRRVRYPKTTVDIGGNHGITTPNQSPGKSKEGFVQIGGKGGITTPGQSFKPK